MKSKEALIKKMKEFISVTDKGLEEKTVDVKEMSLSNLRDCLIGIGTILDEDFELNTYILSVGAGVANRNSAVVATQLSDNKLYFLGYAKEGLINQHTAKKAIDRIIKVVEKYIYTE